ncbi:Saccharopine dehydrogenase, variant 3 [Aspergillus wentii]
MDDARIAVATGVDGVDVMIGTSSLMRQHSHGKDIEYIKKTAIEVINFVKSQGIEVRFSTEDSFRSDLVDLLSIYSAVDQVGVNRVGVADTIGCASPRQVYELIRVLRGVVSCDIETHFHDDAGCAIANAYCALEAGATHIDTSVLGIGERNGITPLGGLMARMVATHPEYVKSKYRLNKIKDLENLVAEAVQINIPFNNYITGFSAFTHKAGTYLFLKFPDNSPTLVPRYPCQSHPQRPQHLRNHQPRRLWHDPLRALCLAAHRLECHPVTGAAVKHQHDRQAVQRVHGQD